MSPGDQRYGEISGPAGHPFWGHYIFDTPSRLRRALRSTLTPLRAITGRYRWIHHVINHTFEYVRGHVHTNSIESFSSVLKRTIKGTYICPRPKHLASYVDEQVFRFNSREMTDGPRFLEAAKGGDGKRLTYKELIQSPS